LGSTPTWLHVLLYWLWRSTRAQFDCDMHVHHTCKCVSDDRIKHKPSWRHTNKSMSFITRKSHDGPSTGLTVRTRIAQERRTGCDKCDFLHVCGLKVPWKHLGHLIFEQQGNQRKWNSNQYHKWLECLDHEPCYDQKGVRSWTCIHTPALMDDRPLQMAINCT
jgi:hypothetical protein